ncbi:MAG TPA: hypothetical protein VH643_35090 [Gemmataceae bacterium]
MVSTTDFEVLMPIQCPTCFRVNPPNAAYCYYDGRGLIEAALKGPIGLGTRPFPMPFSFSDGQGCSNYNQLVLACDRHWNEARAYLVNGTWKSFFGSIGRADLAALAVRSATQTDPDAGLCRLLEGLPADAEALRPAKLALPCTAEELGALEPGKDHKFELVIENQGLLLLSGSAMTDCEWLAFGEQQGNASTKLFQTRDTYTLSLRVVGSKLHAGKQPLEGQIVIDTNGGREIVAVRATVPARPFPNGQAGNDVLAGATSPREIAVRAKAHPQEAAVLFEQGAVKAWYESNGWTYPIRGTQAKGKGALQQFFEALGLTKPPRLEINAEQVVCEGRVGHRLKEKVIVRTTESKFVHAEAHSNQDWIKVLPAQPQGNSVTLPLRIEIPPRPGETLEGSVTVLGNGQQRFVVPVKLTIDVKTDEQEAARAKLVRFLTWSAAGSVVFLALVIAIAVVIHHRISHSVNTPTTEIARQPDEPEPNVERWWDEIPGTNLTASVRELKITAGENRPIFERIEGKSETGRRDGYEQLAAKLPELAGNLKTREALGRFVAGCFVYEPSEFNITPLLRGLAQQFPAEDSPFPPEDKGEGVERTAFWLRVVSDAIAHKDARPDRSRSLVSELGNVLGSALDPDVPAEEFKDQAEKALAEQCYHNLLPTADKSIEQALTIREALIAKFPLRLVPAFRDQDDVKLLAKGLSKDNNLWPRLEPIFKTCLENKGINLRRELIDLYDKANAELAPKMEVVLSGHWKIAGNKKLTQADKAGAIRARIAAEARAAKIAPADRKKRLQELLAKSPLSDGKPKGKPRTAPLLDSVRLAHASTMASILFNKDAEKDRFDELIVQIPGSEQDKTAEGNKPETKPPPSGDKEIIDPPAGQTKTTTEEFTGAEQTDPRRGAYRKPYSLFLRAGETYVLYMRSKALKPYLRLENSAGVRLAYHRDGYDEKITFIPPADGEYRLVASSLDKMAVGSFKLTIERKQPQPQAPFGFPGYLPPRNPFRAPRYLPPGYLPPRNPTPSKPTPSKPTPGKPPADATADEPKAPALNGSDLAELRNKKSSVRIAAFKNLAPRLPNDLSYRQAQPIADYLFPTEWDLSDAELESITSLLPPLAACPHLLEALADAIANREKLSQTMTEAIVSGVLNLNRKLRFERDEDWRSGCRKLLLQHAVDLAGSTSNEADLAAESLCFWYKVQALAFGLDDQDFSEQTRLPLVLEGLIKHVAAAAVQQKLAPAEKAYLEQIGRPLDAVGYAAENDLEQTVLLQRIWIKVLVLALQERISTAAKQKVMAVQLDLDKKDRESGNLLDQLRSGEENILRVWALAHDLKPQ